LVTGTQGCEQLAQSCYCYAAAPRPSVEPAATQSVYTAGSVTQS